MPVIGHAFVGIATAPELEPGGRRNPRPVRPLARTLWLPAVVGLAYLPDVVTQLGLWMGYGSAKLAGHSVLLGTVAGLLVGIVWARLSGGSPRALCVLAIGSILVHDLLDLLQDTDRVPFWPITAHAVGAGWLALPDRLSSELLIFGLPWGLYEARRYLQAHSCAGSGRRAPAGVSWAGRGLVILILVSAVVFEGARADRERRMTLAEGLLRAGHFAEALAAADAADRWPPSRPSRTDIIRGEAYEGLGETTRAELFYLRAYRSDPEDFWAVAELAEFYCSHGSVAARRQSAAPYVDALRRRFSQHPSFRAVMDRVQRAVSKGP
jgi:hypothetical protein